MFQPRGQIIMVGWSVTLCLTNFRSECLFFLYVGAQSVHFESESHICKNVTVATCHCRRIVLWMLNMGQNDVWSVKFLGGRIVKASIQWQTCSQGMWRPLALIQLASGATFFHLPLDTFDHRWASPLSPFGPFSSFSPFATDNFRFFSL